ncbi:MAG: hypothetical protein GXO72_04815 [Caldiserica bacterium]|nr:hypothetical protein [Caldisericota bacterium]
MRRGFLLAALALWAGFAALAQVTLVFPQAQVGPEEVLRWLRQSALPSQEKAIWLRILPTAFDEDLVEPGVAQSFLQRLVGTPPSFISEVTAIMEEVIMKGIPVGHLMNKVSQGVIMGRGWTVIANEIRLRAAVLVATHEVLEPYRPPAEAKASVSVRIGAFAVKAETPTWEDLVVEMAEAISDFIVGGGDLNDWGGMEAFVRSRLAQLRGRGLSPALVDRALEVLSPELVGEIVSRAFQIERRK